MIDSIDVGREECKWVSLKDRGLFRLCGGDIDAYDVENWSANCSEYDDGLNCSFSVIGADVDGVCNTRFLSRI